MEGLKYHNFEVVININDILRYLHQAQYHKMYCDSIRYNVTNTMSILWFVAYIHDLRKYKISIKG